MPTASVVGHTIAFTHLSFLNPISITLRCLDGRPAWWNATPFFKHSARAWHWEVGVPSAFKAFSASQEHSYFSPSSKNLAVVADSSLAKDSALRRVEKTNRACAPCFSESAACT